MSSEAYGTVERDYPVERDLGLHIIEQLMDRAPDWEAIAENGRAWAIAHYAPRPAAARVLSAMVDHAPVGT